MVANEMNRASGLMADSDRTRLRGCYERALALTDLTIRVNPRPALRRELLRWRDLVARLFISEPPDRAAHDAALRVLLLLNPAASRQIPFLSAARGVARPSAGPITP